MRILFEDQNQQYIAQIDNGGVAPLAGDKIRISAHGNSKYYEVVERIFRYDVRMDSTNLVVGEWHLRVTVKLTE